MARYNTSLASATITGATTISTPNSGAFTAFTGTAPYTVTLPSPAAFPGQNQTFYNATSGTVTLSSPAGIFTGTGGSGLTTTSVFTGNVVSVTSDGTNYIVISEDGSILTATTGSFSGDVTINGGAAVVNITAGTVTLAPTNSSNINNMAIGSTTRASGAFTTLAANNSVSFTANTASSSTTTGSLIVTGGVGVSGQVTATNLSGTLQTAAQPNVTSLGRIISLNTAKVGTANDTGTAILASKSDATGGLFIAPSLAGGQYNTLVQATDCGIISNGEFGAMVMATHNGAGIRMSQSSLRLTGRNGSGDLIIDSGGNVGIGATPTAKLDVVETVNDGGWTRIVARESQSNAAFMGTYRSGSTYSTGIFAHNNALNAWANLYLNVHNNGSGGVGGGTAQKIFMGGTIGINTLDPQTTLNISQGAGTASGTGVLRIGGTGNYASLELGIKGSYDGMIRTYGNDLHLYAGHWRDTAVSSENHTMYFYTSQASSSNWSTPKMTLSNVGNLTITGTLTESSSITLKENVDPIYGALASVLQLSGKIYDRIDNKEKREAGLIAEEVYKVLPNLVHLDENGKPAGVKYTKTVAYLVESIKELYEEIRKLKGQ